MDKKKMQRILGILVIIGLVIILFPLLFAKNEIPTTQAVNVSPPPFPEQQSTIPALTEETMQEPIAPIPPEASNTHETSADLPSPEKINTMPTPEKTNPVPTAEKRNTMHHTPEKTNTMDTANAADSPILTAMNLDTAQDSSVITIAKDPNDSEKLSVTVGDPDKNAANDETIRKEKTVENDKPINTKKPLDNKSKTIKKANIAKAKPAHVTQKQLLKLNNKAWVIQMGSFKDKDNARHLADTLRTAGYKAFIQEVKSSNGSIRLRVYIGPEFQQASATSLSAKIKQEMMLHGIVVPYKPLAL